jgi:hypothetical protein
MTKRKRTGAGAIARRREKRAAAAAARAAGAEQGSAGVLPAAAAAITELYRRRSGSASGAAAAASGTPILAVRGRMANSDGRRMMRRAAGVLAPESAASAGEQRRARGRARRALEHRFRVTKALAGYLSFKVLDAYLGGRVPGREPEAGEIGDEATLAVRRRLQVEVVCEGACCCTRAAGGYHCELDARRDRLEELEALLAWQLVDQRALAAPGALNLLLFCGRACCCEGTRCSDADIVSRNHAVA